MSEITPEKEEVERRNLVERSKEEEESETKTHSEKLSSAHHKHNHNHNHHKETHGLRDDIDEETPLGDVRAPNVFERAKEEVEALIQTINIKHESSSQGKREESENERRKQEKQNSCSDSGAKTPKFIENAKETFEKLLHHDKDSPRHQHHKETHGRSDDIDASTPIDEVKGPSVFERAKEEIEAILQAIHPKKDH